MDFEEQTDTVTADGPSQAVVDTNCSSGSNTNAHTSGESTGNSSATQIMAEVSPEQSGTQPTTATVNSEGRAANVETSLSALIGSVEDESPHTQQISQAESEPRMAAGQQTHENVEAPVEMGVMDNGHLAPAASLEEVMQLSPPAANVEIADVAMNDEDEVERDALEPLARVDEDDSDENSEPIANAYLEEPFPEEEDENAEQIFNANMEEPFPGEDDNDDNSDHIRNVYLVERFHEDDDASSSSEVVYDDHMRAVMRELLSQNSRGVGGLLQRDNFMQRMRRAIFSMDHHRVRNRNESSNSNEAEEEPEPENPVSFDTNLPAEHSYLGANMNRVSGVNYLEVGQVYHMMLFVHQHILFPGEVLPFIISGSILEPDLDAQNGLLFGVCFPMLGNDQNDNLYGVTCQIYEKGSDSRGNMLIKSRALQRFVTKEKNFTGPMEFIAAHPQIKCYGNVKILPEIFLPEPLKCINMGSLNRFRDNESMRAMYRRYQAATTPWPAHVYEYYSITSIIEKARTQLAQHKIDTMPTDPTQLSFWLVRNLHLSENMMKKIFTTDSVNMRLKMISTTFKEDALFSCRYCGNRIANCRELFAMSKHGVQTQYCNSAGYIHETNTVYQLLPDAVSYSGEPSSEFSWFPGYQWHIIVCKICSRHIGWKFKSMEPNLVPKSFFGISSSSVRINANSAGMPPMRDVVFGNSIRAAPNEMQ